MSTASTASVTIIYNTCRILSVLEHVVAEALLMSGDVEASVKRSHMAAHWSSTFPAPHFTMGVGLLRMRR